MECILRLVLAWSLSISVAMATDVASVGDTVLCNTESSRGEHADLRWTDSRQSEERVIIVEDAHERLDELHELQRKFAAVELLLSDQLRIMRRYLRGVQPKYSNGSYHIVDEKDDSIEGANPQLTKTSSLYVRWGSTECPETAMKLYEGVVGGAWSLKQGSEVDSQCLPTNPSFPTLESDIHQGGVGEIHKERLSGQNLPYISHGSPCSVCRIELRPTLRMLIERTNCTSHDWTLEYAGSLMTCLGNHGDHNEYLCVDDQSLHGDRDAHPTDNLRDCAVCTK